MDYHESNLIFWLESGFFPQLHVLGTTYCTGISMIEVVGLDYWNQNLPLEPNVSEATCRPFDANLTGSEIWKSQILHRPCFWIAPTKFQTLNVRNFLGPISALLVTTLVRGCWIQVGDRWLCLVDLRNSANKNFSSCHLIYRRSSPSGSATWQQALQLWCFSLKAIK